eukprot:4456403-Pleurochrysis_carterae.AAC.1
MFCAARCDVRGSVGEVADTVWLAVQRMRVAEPTAVLVRRRRHGRGRVTLIKCCCAHAFAVERSDRRAATLSPQVDDARALSKISTATIPTATTARMQEAVSWNEVWTRRRHTAKRRSS